MHFKSIDSTSIDSKMNLNEDIMNRDNELIGITYFERSEDDEITQRYLRLLIIFNEKFKLFVDKQDIKFGMKDGLKQRIWHFFLVRLCHGGITNLVSLDVQREGNVMLRDLIPDVYESAF